MAAMTDALRADTLTRFGLIALATDLTIEGDARLLLPEGTRLHVTRIAFDNPTTPENLRRLGPRLAEAAGLLVPGIPLAGIGFGCTSASAVLGDSVAAAAGDRAPIVTPVSAALRGLRALGVGRIALMTPYLPETAALVGGWFEGQGISVVSTHSLGYADDRDMAFLSEEALVEAARAADHPGAEALFLSCTALPAVPVIARIEALLGKPVLSANQALFWALLDLARIPAAGCGTGRLYGTRTW